MFAVQRITELVREQAIPACLAFVIFFGSAANVSAALPLPFVPPAFHDLPCLDLDLEQAIAKADVVVTGKVVETTPLAAAGLKSKGKDSKVCFEITWEMLGLNRLTMGPMGLEVRWGPSDSQSLIPKVGDSKIIFLSTSEAGLPPTVLKMIPAGVLVRSALPEFPPKPQTLEDLLTEGRTVVVAHFTAFEKKFEIARQTGNHVDWWQKYRVVLQIQKLIRGRVSLESIDGELQYHGSDPVVGTPGPQPESPDPSREYIVFLNVHEPRSPSDPHSDVIAILPADALAMNETPPPAAPPAPAARDLPLPGSDLSLAAASAEAATIVVGRVTEFSVFYTNPQTFQQADTIKPLACLRGKTRGAIQYIVPVQVGKEAALVVGRPYLFFVSHDGQVLKVGPPGSGLKPSETLPRRTPR